MDAKPKWSNESNAGSIHLTIDILISISNNVNQFQMFTFETILST